MSNTQSAALEKFRGAAHQKLDSYLAHTNQIIGVTGFGTALGCVGLDLPSFYAWISMVFLALAWGVNLPEYRSYLAALRSINDPRVHWRRMFNSAAVAIVGWLFLGAVAVGVFNKAGLAP